MKDKNRRQVEKYLRFFGKNPSSLRSELNRKIIYYFFYLRDGDLCYRCGEQVLQGEHSLDHANTFWDAEDPWFAFMDLDECYMSHKSCNYIHGSVEKKKLRTQKRSRKDTLKNVLRGLKNVGRKDPDDSTGTE
jgi:hypothetical protein